jgi:hypothetical protein
MLPDDIRITVFLYKTSKIVKKNFIFLIYRYYSMSRYEDGARS